MQYEKSGANCETLFYSIFVNFIVIRKLTT